MPSKAETIKVPAVPGIDVSHHQGTVDWQAVAGAGVLFAYAKATEGDTFVDPQLKANWVGMKDAGILRGAYHFFRPAKPPTAQAYRFLQIVGNIEPGDLPPMLDIEETFGHNEWPDFGEGDRVAVVLEWLELVKAKLRRTPIIYTRRGFVGEQLGDPGPLAEFPLGIAHYTNAQQPSIPKGWEKWTFWQHSDKGKVNGITGNVDLDEFNGFLNELQAFASQ